MMKKLLFCLLTLVGTGMFYSCQQDEIVNEAPASKGATITATLPTDAQSRLALGDPENGTVKLKWEIGDIVIGLGSLQFKVVSVSEDGSKATLYCEDAPEYLPSNSVAYEFVYGDVVDYDEQSGTLDGLYMTATVGADGDVAWEDVNLEFVINSAIVEIELPEDVSATKVSLYDSSNGALMASTVQKVSGSYSGKVYLSLSSCEIGTGLAWVETSDGGYVAQVDGKSLTSGNIYSINKSKMVALQNIETTETSGTVKYVYVGGICFIYGSGAISDALFAHNQVIQHVIILEGVSSIGNVAFGSNTSLTSVRVPASVNSIGHAAFLNCTSLETIIIEQGSQLTTINESAFHGCTALESITIPASVNSIGKAAFLKCTSLKTITIEQGSHLTTIDESAFYGCTALESIEIPASVTSIGQVAFYGCTSLKTVTCLAVEPPTLGNIVFDNCHGSLTIYVPSEEVETYKGTSGWSFYAGIIQAIP